MDKSGAWTGFPQGGGSGPSPATFHGSDLLAGLALGAGLLMNRLPSYSSLISALGSGYLRLYKLSESLSWNV